MDNKLPCGLSNLDEAKASFKSAAVLTLTREYYGVDKTIEIPLVSVTVERATWEAAGRPSEIVVDLTP